MWLSPTQAVVLPISIEFSDYAKKVFNELIKAGINSEVDLKNQKINFKIREHSLAKIPLLLICGQKEKKDNSITIRRLGLEKQETLKVSKLISEISKKTNLPSNLN